MTAHRGIRVDAGLIWDPVRDLIAAFRHSDGTEEP